MNTQVFDLNNDRVIGYIDYKPGVGNASIKVLGWINAEGSVNKVDDSSARKIFSPRGSVFGPSFFMGQSLFLWDWIKLSQSIENQEHLSV